MGVIRDYTDTVFENYNVFLKEHDEFFRSPSKAMEMLASNGSFNAFVGQLTDGMAPHSKYAVEQVLKRERQMLLEESASGQIGATSSAIGYAVSYFPILSDIYSDPVISQIATTYPVSKSVLSIPKIKLWSSFTDHAGNKQRQQMPRTELLARQPALYTRVSGGTSVNLFSGAQFSKVLGDTGNVFTISSTVVNPNISRVNKRFLTVDQFNYTDVVGAAAGSIKVILRPDARGQIKGEAKIKIGATEATLTLFGSINFDTGVFTFSMSSSNAAVATFNSFDMSVIFSPKSGDYGRTKVSLEMEGWDIDIDNREEFEIELYTEQLQDYQDIYNIDLLRTLSMGIKTQMLLNKDQDLAYFLGKYEADMRSNGAAAFCDLEAFNNASGSFTPSNITDIFKGVVPFITALTRRIHKNFRGAPQYILAGERTAAILESLQSWEAAMPGMNAGSFGANNESNIISFRKQTILCCNALPEGKIYLVYKAAGDDLARTAIADIVYKPLFMVDEITNSMKRTFVKSRTALEVTAPEALGVIYVDGYNKYLANTGDYGTNHGFGSLSDLTITDMTP
jgi:hypothetical protein